MKINEIAVALRSWLLPLLIFVLLTSVGIAAFLVWWSATGQMQSGGPVSAPSSRTATTLAPSSEWPAPPPGPTDPSTKTINPTAGAPAPPGPIAPTETGTNPTGGEPFTPSTAVAPSMTDLPLEPPEPVVDNNVPAPPDAFRLVSDAMAGLITANASWHRPESLTVEQSQLIGLEIGQSDAVAARIGELLPNTVQSPAGSVAVNSKVTARLIANPNDAEVLPSESLDASTPSDISLLWTWNVRPKRPSEALLLTAHIEVPVAGGDVLTTDIPLRIPVRETPSHWFSQVSDWISTHWAMLAGIAAVLGAVATWLRKRTSKPDSEASPVSLGGGHAPPPVGSATPTDAAAVTGQGGDAAIRAADSRPL